MIRSFTFRHGLVSCACAAMGTFVVAFGTPADARASATTLASSAGPCPIGPTAKRISVAVDRGYQGLRHVVAADAPCTLTLERRAPARRPGDPPDATGTVELAFTDDGLQIHFDLQQSTGLTKTVPFAGIDLNADDNINILLRTRASATAFGPSIFTATVNPAGKCSSLNDVPGFQLNHAQCDATPDDAGARLPAAPLSAAGPGG